jgi:hypothetical protein
MRVLAIAAVAALALTAGSLANAADLRVGGRVSSHHSHHTQYYKYYPECSWRDLREPYQGSGYGYGYGPSYGEPFFGALGYRCYRGTYAYFPNPPKCRVVLVWAEDGWYRTRRCKWV